MGHRDTIGTVDRSDDPTEYRFVCAWCAIRICAGCRGELRFQDNRLMALLRVIQEREQRNDLGDPNATSALNIDIQPRAPKLENTQLPTDFSALTPATSSEELLNLSHFGSPGFSGGSTPISRPGTDSSGSETGGPQRRLTEFEEYDGEPCWPPPPRGKRYPTLDQRAELTNIEEYPRQRIPSHQPSQPSGANTQKSYQHLSDPPQWNPHGSSPQPRGPFNPQRRSPEADSPEPELGSDGESETPVESTAGRQMQQQVQPPRQESPLRQEPPPPRQVSPPREPSPPQREATLRSTLRVTGQPEVPLAPPKSPRRKESPPISVPTISMVDTPNMLKVDEPEVTHSEVMQPELKNPGVKQSAINQQPTPKLDQPQVEKKQERRTESPLPIPRPQRESTPRLDKLPRSTPSPRPEPTQVTKMEEKREASSPMSLVKPLPIKKLPEPGVVKPEPAPKPIPKPAEPVLATKQEKPVPTPAKQEKALPEPPKLVKPTIGDFPISKPDTPPAERPVYPTKPEPKVDLSYYYNLEPVATQERLPIADSMQLPEIDFGGTLDTVDISGGFLGRPARTHEKPPAAPIRLGEEKEGSIAGSMKDKKKWRLPGFGKKVEKK
ncbi:hypothetical protein L873DRAFT_1678932 [Choiromyces venosus 120613-1]|uniref:Uncharacterized protein n=1 Tax=Choiromyces venosus 120613-1 TaxID=1336337 RepID=A0A3N4K4D6_9PEZI|nr:hypothetical protein L873DRAFT_1678932 [Choiromyces venosus 120613-1]